MARLPINGLPDVTDPVQLADLRKTFFAGAAILFKSLLFGVSAGSEPDEGDMRMMGNLERELGEFAQQLDAELLGIGRKDPG